MVDDDGTGTTGTIINNAWKTQLYDQIDGLFTGNQDWSGSAAWGGGAAIPSSNNVALKTAANTFVSGQIIAAASGQPSRLTWYADGGSGAADIFWIEKANGGAITFADNNGADLISMSSGLLRLHNYGAGTLVTDASGNITASSDERLKDVVGAFAIGLDAVLGLRPILHHWKAETGYDTENVYAGFSAQNVREFVPEAVGVGLNGMLTVNTTPVLLALVNAVRELTSEVDDIRPRVGLSALSRVATPHKGPDRVIKSATVARLAEESTRKEAREAQDEAASRPQGTTRINRARIQ